MQEVHCNYKVFVRQLKSTLFPPLSSQLLILSHLLLVFNDRLETNWNSKLYRRYLTSTIVEDAILFYVLPGISFIFFSSSLYCHTQPSGHLYPIRIEIYPIGQAEEWYYFHQEPATQPASQPASHPAYNLSLKFTYLCNQWLELYQT